MKKAGSSLLRSFYSKQRINFSASSPQGALILEYLDDNYAKGGYYFFDETGGTIGTSEKKNTIALKDPTLDPVHCQIVFKDSRFCIKDYGSSSGTFIRVRVNVVLQEGLLFSLGKTLFIVNKLSSKAGVIKAELGIVDGKSFVIDLGEKQKITIGRDKGNDFVFESDDFMSNNHAQLATVGGELILEDKNSSNGTWIRLNEKKQQSDLFKLVNGIEFRLGKSSKFRVLDLLTFYKRLEKTEATTCETCIKNVKDAVFLPCGDMVECEACSKDRKTCPLCLSPVDTKLKISI